MLDKDTGIAPTAFTLIELVVVISIIALLLAIIMPSLRAAKTSLTDQDICHRMMPR